MAWVLKNVNLIFVGLVGLGLCLHCIFENLSIIIHEWTAALFFVSVVQFFRLDLDKVRFLPKLEFFYNL